MNNCVFMGRLIKDPEVRYSNAAEPMAIVKFTLAVNREVKKEGQPEADFPQFTAFGKRAEVIEKWCKKGDQLGVVGRYTTRTYDKDDGTKGYAAEFLIDHMDFGAKAKANGVADPGESNSEGFYPVNENIEDDDLPF